MYIKNNLKILIITKVISSARGSCYTLYITILLSTSKGIKNMYLYITFSTMCKLLQEVFVCTIL